jgi:glucose/arabinose dehydrogenase
MPRHHRQLFWRRLSVLVLVGAVVAAACAPAASPASDRAAESGARREATPVRKPTPTKEPRAGERAAVPAREPIRFGDGQEPVSPKAEVVLENVLLPAALSFAPDGRIFFAEVNAGRIRVARDRELQSEPFATLAVQQASESGLLGLALDPDFGRNGFVYAFYSEPDPKEPKRGTRNRVVRFTERNGVGADLTAILGDLPNNPKGGELAHQGGAIAFGPDGKLYVSLGDTGRQKGRVAQDLESLAGKILRVNPDGSVPADNPFPGSPVFALGLRSSWGLAFHPRTGALFASDNGNLDHDEVNLIRPAGNYGWPEATGAKGNGRFDEPIWDSGSGKTSRHGMVGLTVYGGALFPQLRDELLFCTFNDGVAHRATLEPPGYDRIRAIGDLAPERTGDCRLGIAVGPEGAIYLSSLNQVVRLTP